MLNQLIESKNSSKENKSRGGLMLTTFVLVVGLCLSAVTYSLFARDLGGIQALELSTLVAPITENIPPAPIEKQETPAPSNNAKSELPVRQTNTLRIEESPLVPKDVSTVPNTQKARPLGSFLTADALETNGSPGSPFGNPNNGGISGSGIGTPDDSETSSASSAKLGTPPPAPTVKIVEEKVQKPKTIVASGGVVNGKANFLPKPIYTAAAKAVKATGAVNVQVVIDETGSVVSAKAVGGHPLLRMEAEKAARNAKFNPTLLTGQPVKVSGIIVYKFSM